MTKLRVDRDWDDMLLHPSPQSNFSALNAAAANACFEQVLTIRKGAPRSGLSQAGDRARGQSVDGLGEFIVASWPLHCALDGSEGRGQDTEQSRAPRRRGKRQQQHGQLERRQTGSEGG